MPRPIPGSSLTTIQTRASRRDFHITSLLIIHNVWVIEPQDQHKLAEARMRRFPAVAMTQSRPFHTGKRRNPRTCTFWRDVKAIAYCARRPKICDSLCHDTIAQKNA